MKKIPCAAWSDFCPHLNGNRSRHDASGTHDVKPGQRERGAERVIYGTFDCGTPGRLTRKHKKRSNMRLTIKDYNDNELSCLGKWEICSRCRGDGTHDHPAFSNGLGYDDFYGPDADPDFREQYMRGHYDVPCEECNGSGKVLVPDLECGGEAAQAVKDELEQQRIYAAQAKAEYEAERRMGA
jgi:hypothetical protein